MARCCDPPPLRVWLTEPPTPTLRCAHACRRAEVGSSRPNPPPQIRAVLVPMSKSASRPTKRPNANLRCVCMRTTKCRVSRPNPRPQICAVCFCTVIGVGSR